MERIVVGVDGSQPADRALHWAICEAVLHGATIELVYGDVTHPYARVFSGADRDLPQAVLDDVVERNRELLDRTRWSARLADASGAAAGALIDAAADADLVVVGSRGAGGFDALLLGSTSYRTAAHARVPVVVTAGGAVETDGTRRLVVGVDESPMSLHALQWALDEAGRRSSGVTVVHSYQLHADPSPLAALEQHLYDDARTKAHAQATALLDRVVDGARVPDGTDVERVVQIGPATQVLLDQAGGRLLLVGTRGRKTFRHAVFGSVSQQVLQHVTDPVVVVP